MKLRSHRHLTSRFALLTVMAAAGLGAATRPAHAQCDITGPHSACGASALLCGPDGGSSYSWKLPNGSTRVGQCVLASAPGTYTLNYVDASGAPAGPCTHLFVRGGVVPSISGPTAGCAGQAVELCAPAGPYDYQWSGPSGFAATTACVSVGDAGTYVLQMRETDGPCWSDPVQQSVTFGAAAAGAPVVRGDDHACNGSTVQLCGPEGDFDFAWTGPSGFNATTACIDVSASGTYALRTRAAGGACWSDPGQKAVSFSSCTPPPATSNCPRPAWWWEDQCNDDRHHRPDLESQAMSAIAACVASRSAADGSLCRSLRPRQRTLAARARRQVAAAWANICAADVHVSARGATIGLDPSTAVALPGFSGSLSAWLANAEAQLAAFSHRNPNQREVKNGYKAIIRQGWSINHGLGIGPVCTMSPGHSVVAGSSSPNSASAEAEDGGLAGDPEPLAAEMVDEANGPLSLGDIEPNPFQSSMRMGYAISTTSSAEVAIAVYDVSGRRVRELIHTTQAPGSYEVRWDGRDDHGAVVRGGLYFVMGRIGGERVQSRVTYVR